MKQSLLDSLVALPVAKAVQLVENAGHTPFKIPEGVAISWVVRPNTVLLYLTKNKVVETAEAGDTSEVEDDTKRDDSMEYDEDNQE